MDSKREKKIREKKKKPYQKPEITSEEVFEKLVIGCACKTPDGIAAS